MARFVLCGTTWISICLAFPAAVFAQPQVSLIDSPRIWARTEFRLVNAPAAANPFDPDIIRVDAVFTSPSGQRVTVPGFWYQDYRRGLSGGHQTLNTVGAPEWRIRFTPSEPGDYSVTASVQTNGVLYGTSERLTFTVSDSAAPKRVGYVRVAESKEYFETSDGQALPLIGHDVCWPGGRGTYDYDDWFPAMEQAGEDFARLWMCPWAFGIEASRNSLTHYSQDSAWQLDHVMKLAEQRGIYILLCLDYHGMFESTPDYWGGNNNWTNNPYNSVNGGPCSSQNAFFTSKSAQTLYQKRLRYLVGRYGYSPSLLGWEFFNEIDNVYSYLNANDVAAWHALMGAWLHANDPFHHLVTTSLTGSSNRPELWSVPELDFAAYHSYVETGPALRLSEVAQSFLKRYSKPVMVGEFGTDWRGWNRNNDPYLRGLREGIWGGALGGSVGTAMSWWWENIHTENVYPLYSALESILGRTSWGKGSWTNIQFQTSGAPPFTVGALVGGEPFDILLPTAGEWGGKPTGQLAVANPASADYSAATLNSFVHGTAHADLRVPFRLSAWFTNNARLVMHLNSVSGGATMVVRVDGTERFRTNLPNLDGGWDVNGEFNIDIPVNLPSGKHLVEIANAGVDWFYLDWVRLEGVLPSAYSGNWMPSPASIGLSGDRESLLYVIAPGFSYPAGATNSNPAIQEGQGLMLASWPAGQFVAEWYDPATGTNVATTQGVTTNSVLRLALPPFGEDLAGIVRRPPKLSAVGLDSGNNFTFELSCESGATCEIQGSTNLATWSKLATVSNPDGVRTLSYPLSPGISKMFFRAER